MSRLLCPLCQNRFDPTAAGCRSGCPLGKGCTLACCPNCRYSFPIPESKVVDFLKFLFKKGGGQ